MIVTYHPHDKLDKCPRKEEYDYEVGKIVVNNEGYIEAHLVLPMSSRNRELLIEIISKMYDSLKDENETNH